MSPVLPRHDLTLVLPIGVGDDQRVTCGASRARERDSSAVQRPVETLIAAL
jgi:hypothetical protein